MRKKFTLFLFFCLITLLQSCLICPCEPICPPYRPYPRPYWWYLQTKNDSIIIIQNDTSNKDSTNVEHATSYNSSAANNETCNQNYTPTQRYDVSVINNVIIFNVYLGWNVGDMETVLMIRDFPSEGGEIIFNIYTNNLYMSMYGFEKYRTDFYTFSSEPPYCGYSSYSLDTKSVCKYKMNITKNNTKSERDCCGYWACNNGSDFYSSFKIFLYQRF